MQNQNLSHNLPGHLQACADSMEEKERSLSLLLTCRAICHPAVKLTKRKEHKCFWLR